MNKQLQTMWCYTLHVLIVIIFVATFCNTTPAQEMIRNGGFEDDSEWLVYDMGGNEPSEVVFGYTEATPSFGDGACLRIFGGPSDYANILVWQEVDLIGGVEYEISLAFLDLTDDNLPEPEGFWSQIYLSEEEPVDGTDWTPAGGSNSEMYLGFNSWSDCSGSGIDGTYEADACDGRNESIFVAPGEPGQPVLIFVGLKTGVLGSQLSFDIAVDNFSLMGPETNVATPSESIADNFILEQNYPNPFNAGTHFRYALPSRDTMPVQLVIYDLLGQRVVTLVDESQHTGNYSVYWDGSGENGRPLSSGMYIARLSIPGLVRTIKVTNLK